MKKFYVIKDGHIEGSACTRESALAMIKAYQEKEKKAHQWMWAEFSIIEGEAEEHINYK